MGKVAMSFYCEAKIFGSRFIPGFESFLLGQAIECAVCFQRAKALGHVFEPILRADTLVPGVLPVLIYPPARADVGMGHGCWTMIYAIVTRIALITSSTSGKAAYS